MYVEGIFPSRKAFLGCSWSTGSQLLVSKLTEIAKGQGTWISPQNRNTLSTAGNSTTGMARFFRSLENLGTEGTPPVKRPLSQ